MKASVRVSSPRTIASSTSAYGTQRLPLPACSSWWRAGTLARRRPSCLLCHRTQGRRQRSDGSGRSRSERSGACDAVRRCQGVGAAGRRTRRTRRRSWKAGKERREQQEREELDRWNAESSAREAVADADARRRGFTDAPSYRRALHWARLPCGHARSGGGASTGTCWCGEVYAVGEFRADTDEQQLAQRPRAISAPPSASVAHNRSQLTSDQLAYLALKVPGEAARARLAASHEKFRSQHGLPPSTQQKHGPALDVCHPTPDAYRCACCLRGPLPPAHGQADPSDGEWYCNGCWDEWAEPDVS